MKNILARLFARPVNVKNLPKATVIRNLTPHAVADFRWDDPSYTR